ncbi:MAG TPA: DUF6468 domain-containing protein [Stellaceae bacterium]|nr:DUF6468 domain-containing protein [Stellaceae bacterium]
MLSFLGDAVVALLLIATIGYSVVLNRRLGSVRSDREKFEVLARNLNTASHRAEAAVTNLRVTADDLSRRLEKKVEEARALSDDLTYMIERGGGIADKLANQIRAGRDELKPDLRPEPKPAAKPPARDEHRVEPVLQPAPQRPDPPRAEPIRPAFIRAEARAEPIRVEPRVAVPAEPMAHEAEPTAERANAPSRAERNLLRALATRRR